MLQYLLFMSLINHTKTLSLTFLVIKFFGRLILSTFFHLNCLYVFLFLNYTFAGYTILGSLDLFFILFFFFLPALHRYSSTFSDLHYFWPYAHNYSYFLPLYIISPFFFFKDFLYLVFSSLMMMWLVVVFFVFILLKFVQLFDS